jgi:hypothetical protein
LSFFAADVTALPAAFAPFAVASLAASTAPLWSDELALRLRVLAVCERLALERDFAAVRPFADPRLFDRLPELARDLLLVCWAIWRDPFPLGVQKWLPTFQVDQSQIANFSAFPDCGIRAESRRLSE